MQPRWFARLPGPCWIGLLTWIGSGLAGHLRAQDPLPDIRDRPADLVLPPVSDDSPSAGNRVRRKLSGRESDAVYHVLYLPTDYALGRTEEPPKLPVLVEFSGNGGYRNAYGDSSAGIPEGSCLGYGISGGQGYIWLCLPFLTEERTLATQWWGSPPTYDPRPTIDYAREAVAETCREFGGDPSKVVLCGFSRGAIACNYLGLFDDDISQVWCGFVAYSHYDGVRDWQLPHGSREEVLQRLRRLGRRPQFICHETTSNDSHGLAATREFLEHSGVAGDFTFCETGFRNHNDAWVLRDSPARRQLRQWVHKLVASE